MRSGAERLPKRGGAAVSWWRQPALALAGAALVLAVAAYARTFAVLWRLWSHNDNYSHGFLIPPVALALVWLMRRSLAETPHRPSWAGLPVVAAAALLHIAGIRGDVAMFQSYSFIFLVAGLVWSWFGLGMLRQAWFPIAFLAFAAPTFPVFINQVSFRLKALAAFGSVEIAQGLGVAVARQGMDLIFPSGTMTIEGACSGLNSLIALMAMGALFAHLGQGAAWRRVLLFLLAVPVAVAANVVRITSLCIYAALTDTDRATGLFHDVGGFVLYGFALVALLIVKRVLRC